MIDISQVSEMTQNRTAGYRPPVSSRPSFGSVGLPSFNLNSVEWMRRDPQIRLGMAIKKAPYHKVRLSIKGSPEVVQYVSEMVRRFWAKALPRVMNGFWYTMSGGEIINKKNNRTGDLEFWNYQDIYPSDLFILSQGSTPVGISVNMRGKDTGVPQNQVTISNSDGSDSSRLRLFFPKGFLYIHQREFNSLTGISEFEAAYAPWLEKNDYLGARHSRKLWFYKNAFNGGIMFCPPGNYVTEDNQKIPYRDLAQQTLEQASNGAVFTIEQKFDPITKQPLWSYQEPKINPGGRELLDYLHDLDTEELRGLGIPDDVVSQASGGGGSFSGRTIPLMSFFISQEETLNNLFTVCDEQVFRPNCRNKFGHDDYEASMSIDIDRLMGVMNAGDVGSPNEGDGGQSPQEQADEQQGVSPSEKQPGTAQMSLTAPNEMQPLLSSITDAYNDKGPKVRVEMDTGGKIYAIKWGEPLQMSRKAFDETKHARAKKTVVIDGTEYRGGRWIPPGAWKEMTDEDKDKVLDRHHKESVPAYGRRMAEHPRRVAKGEPIDNPHHVKEPTDAKPKVSKPKLVKKPSLKDEYVDSEIDEDDEDTDEDDDEDGDGDTLRGEHDAKWASAKRVPAVRDKDNNIITPERIVILDENGNETKTKPPVWLLPTHITPAWKDVEVAFNRNANQWARGTQKNKGGVVKRVAFQNPERKWQGATKKFKRDIGFAGAFKDIMARNEKHQNSKNPTVRAAADCVYLMSLQGTRVGTGADPKGIHKYWDEEHKDFDKNFGPKSFGMFHRLSPATGEPMYKKKDGVVTDEPVMVFGYIKGKIPITDSQYKTDKKTGKPVLNKERADQEGSVDRIKKAMKSGEMQDASYWLNTWGASQLQARHVIVKGKEVRLQFMSKECKWHDHVIQDPKLANILTDRKRDAERTPDGSRGAIFGDLSYVSLGKHIVAIGNKKITAKDFRTRLATKLAAEEIGTKVRTFDTFKEYKTAVMAIGKKVSRILGNAPSEAIKSYINPHVWGVWKNSEADYSKRLENPDTFANELKSDTEVARDKAKDEADAETTATTKPKRAKGKK